MSTSTSAANANPSASPVRSIDEEGPTTAIARMVSTLRGSDLPKPLVEHAKDLVLDHIGSTLFGSTMPWSRQVRDLVLEEGGQGVSTIFGSSRVPTRAAALVNGAAAHAAEIDDAHDESLTHPGCVVLPAAFAVAESRAASGPDFLAAMVVGYETQSIIGNAIGERLQLRGWHPTASCGAFAAAAATSSLMRLKQAEVVSAFGAAASMASGLMQFTQDPVGTTIKRLYGGLPAERGVFAAQLASKGFASPRQGLEGRFGFARVAAGAEDFPSVDTGPQRRWEIERTCMKLYTCCKLFHALIEAIDDCRQQRRFEAHEVVGVEPFGPRHMIDSHMERRPQSMMAAQYSLPFVTAVAIARDPRSVASFSEGNLDDPEVLRIVDLVEPSVDAKLGAMFPQHFPGGIRIRLRDGTTLTSSRIDSRSSADSRISREEVQDKFRNLTKSILSQARQQQVIDAVSRLDELKAVTDLTALLRAPGLN